MSLPRLAALAAVALGVVVGAAEPPVLPPTRLTDRGALLLSDDLARPLDQDWHASKGKWIVADGYLSGSEVRSDGHAAALRRDVSFRDAVIQISFRFHGGRLASLSVSMAAGHLCRVAVSPNGFVVQKDDTDKEGPDKAAVLDVHKTPIKPSEWHTLVMELSGKEMLASVDGAEVAFGAHDKLDVEKSNIGLIVAGDSVSFRNFRLWAATPNKDWPATKARLRGPSPR